MRGSVARSEIQTARARPRAKQRQKIKETNYKKVCPMRVERTTYSLGGCRSIQLSYEHALPCQTSYFNFKCQENKKNFVALPEATYCGLYFAICVASCTNSIFAAQNKKNKISVGWCLYFLTFSLKIL